MISVERVPLNALVRTNDCCCTLNICFSKDGQRDREPLVFDAIDCNERCLNNLKEKSQNKQRDLCGRPSVMECWGEVYRRSLYIRDTQVRSQSCVTIFPMEAPESNVSNNYLLFPLLFTGKYLTIADKHKYYNDRGLYKTFH